MDIAIFKCIECTCVLNSEHRTIAVEVTFIQQRVFQITRSCRGYEPYVRVFSIKCQCLACYLNTFLFRFIYRSIFQKNEDQKYSNATSMFSLGFIFFIQWLQCLQSPSNLPSSAFFYQAGKERFLSLQSQGKVIS